MKSPSYDNYNSYLQFNDQFLPLIVRPFIFLNISIKLPVAIIASINAKTLLNNMKSPPTQDIEMNSIANEDETETVTNNKSD